MSPYSHLTYDICYVLLDDQIQEKQLLFLIFK
jgi:hypothetical protein